MVECISAGELGNQKYITWFEAVADACSVYKHVHHAIGEMVGYVECPIAFSSHSHQAKAAAPQHLCCRIGKIKCRPT